MSERRVLRVKVVDVNREQPSAETKTTIERMIQMDQDTLEPKFYIGDMRANGVRSIAVSGGRQLNSRRPEQLIDGGFREVSRKRCAHGHRKPAKPEGPSQGGHSMGEKKRRLVTLTGNKRRPALKR